MDYKYTISEDKMKCLRDRIGDDAAIKELFDGQIDGKINKCKKNIIRDWQQIIFADPAVTTSAATEDGFLAEVFARADYKDRSTRDAEAKAEAEKRAKETVEAIEKAKAAAG